MRCRRRNSITVRKQKSLEEQVYFDKTMSSELLDFALSKAVAPAIDSKKRSLEKATNSDAGEASLYSNEARSHLRAKSSRINKRVQITNLGQPQKKNRKQLKKLIKLAKKQTV